MIKINDYVFNKDEILYIEKYGFSCLIVHFKNGESLEIEFRDEIYRDKGFDKIGK